MLYVTWFGSPRESIEGGASHVRRWADVFVPSPSERVALQRRALFFVPVGVERCADLSIRAAALNEAAVAFRGPGPVAGRTAISKILGYKPVNYESALGFIKLANHVIEDRRGAALVAEDIVACVFRLKDATETAASLGLRPQDIAEACKLSLPVVQAALSRYRIQLVDALAIWSFFAEEFKERGNQNAKVDELPAAPESFILTDARKGLPIAVRQLNEDQFVYSWDNLRPAPRGGHFWAVDEESL